MSDLHDSVVLVVGASGALGTLLAASLAEAGATVIRSSRAGVGADLALDFTNEASPASLIAAAVAAHGRLDGVIVAAGVVAFGPASEVADATLDELFQTNALGPMRLIREASPHLAASKAAGNSPFVVTLSGIVAETPTAGLAAYSAAKAALAAFMQASSREFRRAGIRMLDARPGHTETGLMDRAIAGTPPKFPAGHDPAKVAARIMRAILDDEKDLPSGSFQ